MHDPRAIVFDVDGTLYAPWKLRLLLAGLMLRHPPQAARALSALRAFRLALEELRAAPAYRPDDQYRLAARRARLPESALRAHVERWFLEMPLPLLARCRRPGLIPFLDAARSRGVALGVFSDYPAEAKLHALGIRHHFTVVADASDPEIQALKPSPQGLLAVARRLRVAPAQTLYVGDRPLDAEAAARAGMSFASPHLLLKHSL